ncbi:Tc toxin subunit A [Pseudomonas sp. NPDC087615]|uniref:Tc toxin subunit A n=1 Tax=Pseudomonas sp. NPDC087615 TaxID=3364443 RepID=UPI0038207A7D
MADNNSLLQRLVKPDVSTQKGRTDFATAMQKMGFTSVFDIVRQPKAAFVRQLAEFTDANAELAYDNAMGYAALISRLYREYQTSSGKFQQLTHRSGVRALVPLGPTFQYLFKESWDDFCKVGALAAIDMVIAYLINLRVFLLQLEATNEDPKRLLMDRRRPDLKELLITHESTFTPRPMLELVTQLLEDRLGAFLETNPTDKGKSAHEAVADRRYPFELPYNFYHHQCQLGLADKKPRLGELNYRASLLLPIKQQSSNDYGEVQKPVLQAQRLLCGLSTEQQNVLIEPSVFSHFYLTRDDLIKGWGSPGTTHLRPHIPHKSCYLLLTDQEDVAAVNPQALTPTEVAGSKTVLSLTFRKGTQTQAANVDLSSNVPVLSTGWLINRLHAASTNTVISYLKGAASLPTPTAQGYTASFDLVTATAAGAEPVKLARQRFTLTLDEHYTLTPAQMDFFRKSYGVEVSQSSPPWQLTRLTDFMAHTGLNAEQVEMLLCRQTRAVRLSPNCPSQNPQHGGVTLPQAAAKVLPFPHPNQYGACYVNGTGAGADLYDSEREPDAESIIRDQFDNAMGLEQITVGDSKQWRLSKTSLNRLDRLQRMIRLQRWLQIPFAKLDTLIMSAIRAEGEDNLAMELNENTLRALGVYRYLNRRHGIEPEEFAALMHDLSPYASGKDEMPLFDQVFNRVQLFDTPLVLDQQPINLEVVDTATQKTVLQLCAGLGVQPTEDSFLLIALQTQKYLTTLKRDLPTVSSFYRQARIARLFGCSVAELLTLAGLLGGSAYKTVLASGHLNAQKTREQADILDVLMQLDWAVDWLKDSQQTVTQLQQRLGPHASVRVEELDGDQQAQVDEPPPLPDDLLERLSKLQDDTRRSMVTKAQVAALGLPLRKDGKSRPQDIQWFGLLVSHKLITTDGLLMGLDRALTLVDEPITWLQTGVAQVLKDLDLEQAVKDMCAEKLIELLLGAHDRQVQLLEGLFQETAKLAPDRCRAVIHWAQSSVYSILVQALKETLTPALIEHYQRVSRHAEIVVQLRLSNSALRLFVVNPTWLGGSAYEGSNSEPWLCDLYLLERFSQWFHSQSQSEDSVLSYFSGANPAKAQLKNKALRTLASETANAALARLLEWSEMEVTTLTSTLPDERASSMAQVDWVRRCQATCQASGLSAKALLQATGLTETSLLNDWKIVGDAVMAANSASDSTLANG